MVNIGFLVPNQKKSIFQKNMFFVWKMLGLAGHRFTTLDSLDSFEFWGKLDALVVHSEVDQMMASEGLINELQQWKDDILILNHPDLRVWESQQNKFFTYYQWGIITGFPQLCMTSEEVASYAELSGAKKLSLLTKPLQGDKDFTKSKIINRDNMENNFGENEKVVLDIDMALDQSEQIFLDNNSVLVQKVSGGEGHSGHISVFFVGGKFSHAVKLIEGEPFRVSVDGDFMQFVNYFSAVSSDIMVDEEVLDLPTSFDKMTHPLYTRFDFSEENGKLVPFNVSFFASDLFLLENPSASSSYVSELIHQVQRIY